MQQYKLLYEKSLREAGSIVAFEFQWKTLSSLDKNIFL